MAHRTVRCPSHVISSVGFRPLKLLTSGPALMSGGAPDMHCRVSGAPAPACLTTARFCHALNAPAGDRWREVAVAPRLHRTVRCTPDSPVNFSGAAFHFPEAGQFRAASLWSTGHCPVMHRTVRCIIVGLRLRNPKVKSSKAILPGAPDSPVCQTREHFGFFLLLCFEPCLVLSIGFC